MNRDAVIAYATDKGLASDVAGTFYDLLRDAEEHQWYSFVRERLSIELLCQRAAADLDLTLSAAEMFMATDGLRNDEGQRRLRISNKRYDQLEMFLLHGRH